MCRLVTSLAVTFLLCAAAPIFAGTVEPYVGVTIKRPAVVVTDLDRALVLWRDILGMRVHQVNDQDRDSLAYDLFDVPRDATLRFASFDAGPGEARIYGLLEVTGIDVEPIGGLRRAGVVINAHGRWDEIRRQVEALGLAVLREKKLVTADGDTGVETGFVDWDGNLIVVYQLDAAANACPYCPETVVVPAGEFLMGSTEAETRRERVPEHQAAPERPRQRVRIAKPFALSRTEITVAEYAAFATATGRPSAECQVYGSESGWVPVHGSGWDKPVYPQADDHPVSCVSWEDAAAYAEWLADATGKPYRLPSEAEWEYAARAGTQTARYWGDGPGDACRYANVADASSHRPQFDCDDGYSHTAPATFGIANDFGLHGMLGNLGEWVADCGMPDYATQTPADGTPYLDGDCTNHVGRGGSWWNDAYYIRAARRFSTNGAYYIMGFRVAMDLD